MPDLFPRAARQRRHAASFMLLAVAVAAAISGLSLPASSDDPAPAATPAAGAEVLARGKLVAEVSGCVDCHTPRRPDLSLDMDYYLAGHRESDPIMEWSDSLWNLGAGMIVAPTGTAYAGPWGVTFARNLTPDKTTGIGGWNEEAFIYVLREGQVKPPMHKGVYGRMSDEDLKALFAYLMSQKPIRNQVPFRRLAPPRLPDEPPGSKAANWKGAKPGSPVPGNPK